MGCNYISAGSALSVAQRHRPRIRQFTKQGANIAFRYVIASHKKSHRDIPKQLVQRRFGATLVKHDLAPTTIPPRQEPAGE
jgi:hypothetical protein